MKITITTHAPASELLAYLASNGLSFAVCHPAPAQNCASGKASLCLVKGPNEKEYRKRFGTFRFTKSQKLLAKQFSPELVAQERERLAGICLEKGASNKEVFGVLSK